MAKTSPTQRALAHYRDQGFTCAIVERWNQYAKVRQDLFGCLDLVAILPSAGILGIQATSGSNVSARVAKILAEPRAGIWLASGGRIHVIGFSKKGPRGKAKRWTPRVVEILTGGITREVENV